MLLGVIADDFTGASDIANTIARGAGEGGGLSVAQFLGVPAEPAPERFGAGVVSLKSRSIPAEEAVRLSLQALQWLREQGCRQFFFKYCSTFDSTPDGNIGPVGEALARELGVSGVVACPSFPATGRTVYQGHLFVNDMLLSESGMENHPLTPMTDPDIRRWLSLQTRSPVGLVPLKVVREGQDAIQSALMAAAGRGETMVVVDAATDEDVLTIGAALSEAPLVSGGSAIAAGLAANFVRNGEAWGSTSGYTGVEGPEAILSGSCSRATRGQIATHLRDHPGRMINVDEVMQGKITPSDLVEFALENQGRAPLIYSSCVPSEVAAAQQKYGREEVAGQLETLFAEVASELVAAGVRRLVVAGGETSGAVAQALHLGALEIGPELAPGVPILTNAERSIALALKSGNFGSDDFFSIALHGMKAPQ